MYFIKINTVTTNKYTSRRAIYFFLYVLASFYHYRVKFCFTDITCFIEADFAP